MIRIITLAIIWLCTVEYSHEQRRLGVRWGKHPILEKDNKITEIAEAVHESALKYEIDPYLILSVAWRESRFVPKIANLRWTGKRGEIGLMQVHGVAARGCCQKSISGQIDCGTKYLKQSLDLCKSTIGGLSKYMTGKSCRHIYPAKRRHQIYRRLRKEFQNDI